MSTIPATTPSWRMRVNHEPPLLRTSIPTPIPGSNDVLVKILAHGVCHSDCGIRDIKTPPPNWAEEFTLGHEGAGEIVQLGLSVSGDWKIGDRVVIHIVPGCGKCPVCLQGHPQICRASPDNGAYGLGRDGLFQQYVSIRADALALVPDSVPIAHAAIAADAILTAYHAVKYTADLATAPETKIVLILGLGGLGLNAVQIALHLGVNKILIADKRKEAVDIAVKLGIPEENAFCTSTLERPLHELLASKRITIDIVLDFVGHEETLTTAQLAIRPAGLIVMVGLISPTATLIPVLMVSNMINIKGSFAGTIEGLRECLELLERGVIKPEIITGSIEDVPQVLKELDEGKYQGRKVLLPDWKDL